MSFSQRDGYCFLEAFRPAPGQRLEWAGFSTYSLDLVALVALLMELADVDGEGLGAGDVPFVRALETLENKVAILCQRGRISLPRTPAHRILILLDRFIRQIDYDERDRSWHAKIGLAKYGRAVLKGEEPSSEWRLWLGSRNLTQNLDWEAGIMLVGRTARRRERPREIEGLQATIGAFLSRVWLNPKRAATEATRLRQVIWRAPHGVDVEEIIFRHENNAPLLVPSKDSKFRSILAVAPFVDAHGLKSLAALPMATGKDVGQTVVTTMVQISRQRVIASATELGVTLRLFASPSEEGTTTLSAISANAASGTVSEPSAGDGLEGNAVAGEQGIHAKLILGRGVRKGSNALWIGSSNLTGRGLLGRNAEIIARLRISDDVADGLYEFLSRAREFDAENDPIEETELDRADRDLQQQRNALIAQANFKLIFDGTSVQLAASRPPVAAGAGLCLDAALLSTPHVKTSWPPAATIITLAECMPQMRWTDMVAFELRHEAFGISTCWVQRVEAHGFDLDIRRQRDHLAIVDYLGNDRFALWLEATISGKPGVSEQTWDGRRLSGSSHEYRRPRSYGVTLESMLANWARNPDAVSSKMEEAISTRMEILRRSLVESGAVPEAERIAALASLEQFGTAWRVLAAATARGRR